MLIPEEKLVLFNLNKTSSIYFMESNISVPSSKLLMGLSLPLSNLTFSSESTPTTSLSPSDLAYYNNQTGVDLENTISAKDFAKEE